MSTEQAPISQKETTLHKAAIETDYTGRKNHSVGQIVHNIHKLSRTLQKVNYPWPVDQAKLEKGDPAQVTPILKHIVFKSSAAMRDHLESKGISLQTEYLPELKFCKALQNMCADLFAYRVELTPDQFTTVGYAERKMILVLDLYDLVKQVRKQTKVQKRLTNVDKKWEHPCDVALKDYAVCDHQAKVTREM